MRPTGRRRPAARPGAGRQARWARFAPARPRRGGRRRRRSGPARGTPPRRTSSRWGRWPGHAGGRGRSRGRPQGGAGQGGEVRGEGARASSPGGESGAEGRQAGWPGGASGQGIPEGHQEGRPGSGEGRGLDRRGQGQDDSGQEGAALDGEEDAEDDREVHEHLAVRGEALDHRAGRSDGKHTGSSGPRQGPEEAGPEEPQQDGGAGVVEPGGETDGLRGLPEEA